MLELLSAITKKQYMFCLDTDVWDRLLRSDKKAKEEQKITYRLVTQRVAL